MSGACTNPDRRPGLAKCFKCGSLFCDSCLAFVVNQDPYCEVCGNKLLDDLRPRWLPAVAIFLSAFVLVVLGNGAYWMAFGYWRTSFSLLGFVLLLGAAKLAWHVADPIGSADKPRVMRREPGGPLPRR
jgi:hypothetical protein